jgi:hypothetical protein
VSDEGARGKAEARKIGDIGHGRLARLAAGVDSKDRC